jgi:hypothetical protein
MVETIMEGCDDDNTTKLTAKQERRIVTQCLYLRKAYEIAVQCMNAWTWNGRSVVPRPLSHFVTVE